MGILHADYTIVREDRKKEAGGGGGLAFLVHTSILFQKLQPPRKDPHLEYQGIKVGNLNIHNIYIPPVSSCTSGYTPSLTPYFHPQDSLIVGDINAHDDLWFSPLTECRRGPQFSEEIGDSNYATINEDTPTRLPTNGNPSSPDISLASMSLLPYTSWETETSLGSDHLPIIISLETDLKPTISENRTFINFKKANWTQFESETEAEFSKLPPPPDVYTGEKVFRKIINKKAKAAIPSGRIKNIFPEIPTEAIKKIKDRDALRKNDPKSPLITQLNNEISTCITDHKREKWRNTVESIDRKTNSAKLFKLIKHLNGASAKSSNNEAIKFKGKYITNPNKISKEFNKQYSLVIRHTSAKSTRITTRASKKMSLGDAEIFTTDQTTEAIKKAKPSKALGPDGISTLHLKHLGENGIKYLTQIFNISTSTSTIPEIWKTSAIIPLLKPKKPAEESTSYRPVSLLCPAIKILERLILPSLTEHLPVPDIQHGFRQHHSTVTALNEFNEAVADGFNMKKPPNRTVLLQIDLSKAFDMVNHEKLIKDLNQTTLPEATKRWFSCYLHGRQSRVSFRNTTSSARNVRTGVPQGAVTSPIQS